MHADTTASLPRAVTSSLVTACARRAHAAHIYKATCRELL